MAAVNVVNVTTIYGKTVAANLTSTSATSIVSNAASSSTLIKINTLNITNTTGTAVTATIYWNNGANLTGTSFNILNTSVPPNSALTAIDKNAPYYLEEGQSIGVTAATANTFIVTCSYEVIS
jgi:hypothetical protein